MTKHLIIVGTQNIDYNSITNTTNYNNIASDENISDKNCFIKVFISDKIKKSDTIDFKPELKYKKRLENNLAIPKRKKYLKF